MFAIEQLFPGLLHALLRQESGDAQHPDGYDNALGDRNLAQKAYGPLQIRAPYFADARMFLSPADAALDEKACLGNRPLSIRVLNAYMTRYCTPKRLGRAITAQDVARIHNGGPNGWRSPATLGYWAQVQTHYVPS